MAELQKKDFIDGSTLNKSSVGQFSGKTRIDIVGLKIKKGLPFYKGSSINGQKVYGQDLIGSDGKKPSMKNWPYTLVYGQSKTAPAKSFKSEKITKFFKDEDFGGGGSRAKQADNTGPTESGCAYYCSLAFNVKKGLLKKEDCSKANLKKAAAFVKATSTLDHFLKNGPDDWHEENVYINTANAVYEKFKNKFNGTVYCHRGSKFMTDLYDAFKKAKKLDEKEDQLAPGSFNNDKWNPGDIWLSTYAVNEKPLEECRNLIDLKKCVIKFAGMDGNETETKLLAVSLKKPGNPKKALLKEYNTKTRTNYKDGSVSYDGFSYGKTGDFFSSNDVYLYMGKQDVQFRAFNTTSGWQGNIIGTGALGGKIGGGNIDFYMKKAGMKSISAKPNEFKETTTGMLKPKDYELLFELYKKYFSKQSVKSPVPKIDSFTTFKKNIKEKGSNFAWQKLMGMRMIDEIESSKPKSQKIVATEILRYAASNTEISTYFIKIE